MNCLLISAALKAPLRLLVGLIAVVLSLGAAAEIGVPPPPAVAARAYILMDYDSGQVLAESKSDARMEPASLTKLMTSYVLYKQLQEGRIRLGDMTTVSQRAWRMEGSRSFVPVGRQVSVEDLLKGMIVQSGNDATVALAEYAAGSEDVFVSMMNREATRLGLTGTHYMDSTGMPDPQHYTTARDLALLTRAIIHDFPDHYQLYSLKQFTYNGITQRNRNLLLWRDPGVDGVKTGHTDSAGYCLVASARQNGMRLISVVLGTASEAARADESEKLLSYGFRFYETHRVYATDKPLSTVRVWKGAADKLPLGLQQPLYVTIPRGQYDKLAAAIMVQQRITAPVVRGTVYGSIKVSLAGETVAARPLVAFRDVPAGGLFTRMVDDVRLWFE